VSLPPPGP